jgi:hypothetical protein
VLTLLKKTHNVTILTLQRSSTLTLYFVTGVVIGNVHSIWPC